MPNLVCTTCFLVQPCACMYGRARARTEADIQAADRAHVDAQTAACRRLQTQEGGANAAVQRLREADREAVRAAFRVHRHVGTVAQLLGVSTKTVRRWLREAPVAPATEAA